MSRGPAELEIITESNRSALDDAAVDPAEFAECRASARTDDFRHQRARRRIGEDLEFDRSEQ